MYGRENNITGHDMVPDLVSEYSIFLSRIDIRNYQYMSISVNAEYSNVRMHFTLQKINVHM
jgi:hypothetical protein